MIIDEHKIFEILAENQKPNNNLALGVLAKALELKGLTLGEVSVLLNLSDRALLAKLFETAKSIKDQIYGKRLVIFAPLYISNKCSNDCLYCAFRTGNKSLKRRTLSQEEIYHETNYLINQGHRRLLLVAGENYTQDSLEYVLESIATIYKVQSDGGKICRINVNVAALTIENFRLLKEAKIGTYQLFQETYHRDTYKQMHLSGKKSDYDWHITAMDRAMEAGIDDVGIGALLGLTDWRFEVLAMIQHAKYLSDKFGVGPHTISVPRLEPANGSEIASSPPNLVTDLDFCKLVAILRLAVPYTGIILSTRESVDIRRRAFDLGVSQISAGSRTNPGGYLDESEQFDASQFSLGDHRELEEVIRDVISFGYLPSFCTSCYRLGRTGDSFMQLAKDGKIGDLCLPNAIITLREYLAKYASFETRAVGEKLIEKEISNMTSRQRELFSKVMKKNSQGKEVFI